jgi:hypothetical protein
VIERNGCRGRERCDRSHPASDPQVPIDMIYGPIDYRLLVRHQELDERFGKELVDHIISYVKS